MSGRGPGLYRRARQIIPGGTQLLSKRPEMFLPEQWPTYFRTAKGAHVTDLDGRSYLDMSTCGIGATVLGFADEDVDDAVRSAISMGTMCTLNCEEEVQLAELLIELHPWAEMVRFGRSGGEALAIAIRIARAATRRDAIAFCGYHGWHDWYLSANLAQDSALDGHLLPGLDPLGVPRGLAGLLHPFRFNRLDELEVIIAEHGHSLAAIVMEPVRNVEPTPEFLRGVRRIADETSAVLIFDEVTAGFRMNTGGAHLYYAIDPDVAVFAKAIANGYPMAAVLGRGKIMEAAQDTFISSTAWTERIGFVAALATLRKHGRLDVSKHLSHVGRRMQLGWRETAERYGLPIEVSGIAPLSHFKFNVDEAQALRTLFTQMMLDRGILAGGAFYAMYAHTDSDVDRYLEALDEVFGQLKAALENQSVRQLLRGPIAHAGFHRLT